MIERLRTGLPVSALCAAANLSDAAMRMLAGAPHARTFVERLAQVGEFDDGVAFLAHALPRHDGVSWAWLCASDATSKPRPAILASLEATRWWLDEPTEPHRKAALRAAEVVGLASPAGLAGLAAFLCGDSPRRSDMRLIPPPSAAAKAIAGCVHLAVEAAPYGDVAARYRAHIHRGIELGDQIDLWSPPRPHDDEHGNGPR